MSSKKDDRLLTGREYVQFMKDCEELERAAALVELSQLCETQEEKLQEQTLYIKLLEELNAARSDKLLKLQENLEQLEKELIKLRCPK